MNEENCDRYRILILSSIPAVETNGLFSTIDLWARDLETQCRFATVHLLCPVESVGAEQTPINSTIRVHSSHTTRDQDIANVVSLVDVVQLPGNIGWRESNLSRRLLGIARRLGKRVVLGVSSNRAKTAWLNSRNRFTGAIKYLDIRTFQSWVAARSDGVFVVGEGLLNLFEGVNSNVHVGIASWIERDDIVRSEPESSEFLRLCIASRIEKMKGMHIGVAATELVYRRHHNLRLLIIGDGPERDNIKRQVASAGLGAVTSLRSTVAYPQPFLSLLRSNDIVLLTNLSDEQPRLIFDAISQGCLPICPNNKAYRNLGLDEELFYKQGDAESLSQAIEALFDITKLRRFREKMLTIAERFTLESMHRERSLWIAKTMRGPVR